MNLSQIMEFDCPVRVHDDGSVTNELGVYAPDLYEGELPRDSKWELLNGYSGQDSYAGPIMHPSEFIGGLMEQDILETPGVYVAIVAYYEDVDDQLEADGWAVARLIED